ncbi:YARHG domain protein [uncultured Leptotrichia sp.]|uniref:YARHG domain-containing protein n=1 Tax=uncultured Leptotrichia sp. TaxID=159271 RepID=UPI001A436E96|nr:YARHG domain-containing protein [uncultured Leptotrichia sp.]VTX70036.1 YARHG domain protein [uncultured Leptotrichia sp.]
MKKLSIVVLILAFMASCSNQNKDNNAKDTRYQSATYTKPQNPQGATVALNSTDFRVDNNFIYYKGAIFTGKITFDLPQKSGYFFVSNGKLQGETEINYKLTGTKKVQVYEEGKLMQLTQTENNVTTVVNYSDDPASIDNRKIVKVATKYDKNSYSMDFVTLDGEIKKDGKTLKDLEVKEEDYQKYVSGVIGENGGIYKIYYSFDKSTGEVTETQYKLDSKKQKIETLSGIRKLSEINMVLENGMTLFRRIMSATGESATPAATTPVPGQSGQPAAPAPNATNSANSANTTNPANPPAQSGQDEDLATLDRVYDEVMHKNNENILKTFSKQKLGYIRNTLFAKKGYIFTKNLEYANYFSKKSWYQGRYNTDNLLNKEEQKFVEIIQKYEK